MADRGATVGRGWTPKKLESLKPAAKPYEVTDPHQSGLALRVLPNGRKVFRWYITALKRVVTIGPWSFSEAAAHVTLAEARIRLERLKRARAAGKDQLDVEAARLRASLRPRDESAAPTDGRLRFRAVADEWFTTYVAKNRKRPGDARAILDRDILPLLGDRPIAEVSTLDCRDVVKRAVERGVAVHAGKVLATLKQLLAYAERNDLVDRNRAASLRGDDLGVESNQSGRALADTEIPALWRALDAAVAEERPAAQKLHPATAAALKILLLTAARTGELLRARWTDVDLGAGTWRIPLENQKLSKKQEAKKRKRAADAGDDGSFRIALPPTALDLFRVLKRESGDSPWVVAGKPRRKDEDGEPQHYDEKSFGHAVRRLIDRQVIDLPGGPFSPHDLRRTARSHLSRLRVPHWIIERVLNHSLGRLVGTYDVYDYFEERKEALLKLDEYVKRLLDPGASNVVPMIEGVR